jgi:hypothetical protein
VHPYAAPTGILLGGCIGPDSGPEVRAKIFPGEISGSHGGEYEDGRRTFPRGRII